MGSDFIEIESKEAFAPTLKRIEDAIASHGMAVFARVDHAEAAKSVGLSMPPTIVLLYGNPKGGTPMMLASPRAALDLPLRVLVREEDGRCLSPTIPLSTCWRGPAFLPISPPDSVRRNL